MPTYDYECKSCGHTFELLQSMSAARIKKCPKCLKLALRRLIGAGAGLIFKGSGFYATDYKKSGAVSGSNAKESAPKCDSAGKDSKCASCPAANPVKNDSK